MSERGWVSVGWMKNNGLVQMATDREQPKQVWVFESEQEREQGGTWVDFPDRAAINDLIRLLRKARDQAFGRDE
jgi:hypothetical protein